MFRAVSRRCALNAGALASTRQLLQAAPAAAGSPPPPPPAAPTVTAAPAAAAAPAAKLPGQSFTGITGARVTGSTPCGEHCRVVVDSHMFAWIIMDRAGSSANALGASFMASLASAFDHVDQLVTKKQARIAILTSAKDTFCVGADLEQLYPVTDPAIAAQASKAGQDFFNRIEKTTYPVIAAVNGMALGGGCELALACHHRILADSAQMGLPEVKLGLLPGAGGTVRLQRLIGIPNALGWILQGGNNRADKCRKAGAVDAVVPSKDRFKGENRFFEGVRAWAGKLADKPLRPAQRKSRGLVDKITRYVVEGNPLGRQYIIQRMSMNSLAITKGKYIAPYYALECVLHASANPASEGYAREAKRFSELMVTPEAKNLCALYFLTDSMKKLEKKTGLAKDKIPEIKSTGVMGAGVMGSGIVHLFANKGYKVALKDVSTEKVDAGTGMVKKLFEEAVKKKRLDDKGLAKKMGLITGGTTNDIFKGVDVIVEAAVEIMDVKKKLLKELEDQGILDGKRIFATNTSSLSLTDLQSVSKYPQQVVGMHFFNPVAKMPLVEVIKGKHTSPEAVAAIYNLALKTGKNPIIVGDAPGFLVNRILGVYMAEAGRLAINDRADPNRIDAVIKDFGMPMGPFRLLDEVGLDVACHVGPVLENGLKSKRFTVAQEFEQMVKEGYLGKKNGKGLYRYDARQKELGMDTTVTAKFLCSQPNSTFSTQDILDRCVLLMVNEASMILSEGICASPEDVDMGMIFGTGFPPFRGGLLQYADHRGLPQIVDRLSQLQDRLRDERFAPSGMLKDMVKSNKRFFPSRPFVPYVERVGFPTISP